ncbi:MAG: hypothetical protein HYW05_04210 [Candidatus Diapherotrites archaeon]|nr:hypothetical protein [Candidatus Diapherotrites archaeon]
MHEKRIARICAGFVLIFAFTLLLSNLASAADSNASIVTCNDSDGGEYLYTAGSCKYVDSLGVVYGPTYDTCTENNTYVEEQLCNSSNSCYGRNLQCPNGCNAGACLSIPEIETGEISLTLYDEHGSQLMAKINLTLYSDSGSLTSAITLVKTQSTESGYSVFSSVPAGTYYIYAEDPGSKYSAAKTELFKVYANSGSAVIITMKLTSLLRCEDYRYSNCPSTCTRKCLPSSCSGNICTTDCEGSGSCFTPSATCIDTDGGKDTAIKGSVTGTFDVEYRSQTDYCTDTANVMEFYCTSEGKTGGDVIACASGCSNGACVPTGGLPDISIYKLAAPSSVKVNEKFSIDLGIINKGSAAVSQAFLISAKSDSGAVQIYDNKFSLYLSHNQSAGTALTGYATKAGTYKITIYADYLNQIPETDESNNSYTFTLQVSEEQKKVVKLGEEFSLNAGEKAYLESDNIEIQLTSVNYPIVKCSYGEKCPGTNPEAQISITQGSIGTSTMLSVGGTANVFGVEIKNTAISADNWASFVITKETTPEEVKARLGEHITLEEKQTARVFSESGEELMKVTVDDIVVYGDVVCVKAPCEAAEYAQLTVSIASGSVHVIRIKLSGYEYVENYKITLSGLWTTVEGRHFSGIMVEKAEKPDLITVSLNSGFNLQLHQTALVKETELKITLEGLDAESGTAAFSVSQANGQTDYIKLNTQRKGLNVQEIFGHEITLTNVGRDSASLIVRRGKERKEVTAYLNDKFSLFVNQTANVYDGQMQEARALNIAMNITLQGLEEILCATEKAEKGKSKEMVRCDSRPVARIMVQLVPSCPKNAMCVQALPQYISLREGEERALGNYSIRLLDIGSGNAVFIVKKSGGEEIITAHLNEQFDLKVEQTAYVVEEGLNIKLHAVKTGSAKISVWKYETIAQPASDAESATASRPPVAIYTITEGETLSLYGLEIKLTKASGNAAAFLVTKGSEAVINVHTNEPFKLSGQQAANVLEANLRIDILQINSSNSQVEFSVSNYLLSAKETGKRLEQETYETTVKKTQVAATSVAITGHAAMQVISMPPMPFETYRLGAGESVDVGDFTIKVIAVGGSSAEFIVTEKNTDLRIKLEIYKGWNLISLPGEIDGESAFDCEVSDWRIFEYNTAENKFEPVTQPSFTRAIWLYNPGKGCSPEGTVRKSFPLEFIAPLEKGWNFIPVFADMLKKKITDFENCEFKAAYFYNANSRKWEKALTREISESDLGKGMAVYAEESCILGEGEIEPPMPDEPEEPENPEPEPNVYACEENDDCISVQGGCCGCSSGGSNIAINKKYSEYWDELLSEKCRNTLCPTVISDDWTCFAPEPKCQASICVLERTNKEG